MKALVAWSSGKDSAWCLHILRRAGDIEVAGLLTTVNERYKRVAMHAVRVDLLESQARAIGVPLWIVPLPDPCSNDEYESRMAGAISRAKGSGITAIAFGDLFLEDVRRYREKMMKGTGILPLFPLWGSPTDMLARDMIDAGVKAMITCIDPRVLPEAFVGREFDASLLDDLPPGVDPCGEKGEFHTFVYNGPMFHSPVSVTPGKTVKRNGFVFQDVVPV